MKFPQDVPVLTDGVVTLRAHDESDLPLLYEISQDPVALQWTAIPLDNSPEDSRFFATELMRVGWEVKNHRGWAIEAVDDNGNPTFAGNIDIRDTPIADVGYVLHPWARGRGFMKRALALATNWAFTEGGAEIVHWRAHVGNATSLRTAWSAGFTLHGTIPGLLHERGNVFDAWTASIRFGDLPLPRTTWHESTLLQTERIRLRPFKEGDVARIVEACRDQTSRHWLAGLPVRYDEKDAQAFIADNMWRAATGAKVAWAIADPMSDELLGTISIMGMDGLDPSSGEIGYWAHPDARGRGIITEATRLTIEHCFDTMGLRRMTLMAATENRASNKIALATGFKRVGTETRAEKLGDDTFSDLNVYELLAR